MLPLASVLSVGQWGHMWHEVPAAATVIFLIITPQRMSHTAQSGK